MQKRRDTVTTFLKMLFSYITELWAFCLVHQQPLLESIQHFRGVFMKKPPLKNNELLAHNSSLRPGHWSEITRESQDCSHWFYYPVGDSQLPNLRPALSHRGTPPELSCKKCCSPCITTNTHILSMRLSHGSSCSRLPKPKEGMEAVPDLTGISQQKPLT